MIKGEKDSQTLEMKVAMQSNRISKPGLCPFVAWREAGGVNAQRNDNVG